MGWLGGGVPGNQAAEGSKREMAAGWGCRVGGALIATLPCPGRARSSTLRAAVAADHAQRLIPAAMGLQLAPGRPGLALQLPPGHPVLEAPPGWGGIHRQPRAPHVLQQRSHLLAADPRRREPCPVPLESSGARHPPGTGKRRFKPIRPPRWRG